MTELSDNTVVATELVSNPQKIAAPRYRYVKMWPTQGASSITITPGTGQTVQFEIPTRSINYSLSYICGKMTFTGDTDYAHWMRTDAVTWCQRLSYKTRSGATMIELDHLDHYTAIANRYETPVEEVVSGSEQDVVMPCRNYLYYTEPVLTELKTALVDSKDGPIPAVITDAKNIGSYDIYPESAAYVKHPFVEAKYCKRLSTDLDDDGEHRFMVPLNRLVPNSVFSRRSDMRLPEIGILTLTLNPGNKIAWESKSIADPTNNAKAEEKNCTLTDFYLLLAIQEDPLYEAMQDERMSKGYSIPINYPFGVQTTFSNATTSQNVSFTFNSGHGRRLVKLYHTVFPSSEEKNLLLDHRSIYGSQKVGSYHVKINGLRTTDEDLKTDPADPTAYLYHRPLLDGTSIVNADVYHQNFAHIEDIGRIGGPKRWKELNFRKDDALVGEPLDKDLKFEFVSTTQNTTLTHYTFAVLQRQLSVNSVTAVVE